MSYAPANFEVAASNGFEEKIHNLTFDLGPTKCCPVSFIQLQRLKLLRLMVQEEMLLHKNTLFDLCP